MSEGSRLGELKGRSGVKGAIEHVRSAVADFTETIEDLVIEGDKAVTRYICTGVHRGPYFDIAPTGRPIYVDEISIYHVRNGLVTEQWCLGEKKM